MKQRIVNYLLKNLLNAVIVTDVLQQDKKGLILLNHRPITDTELRQLIAEAKAIEGTRLWSIMNESLKAEALARGWNNSVKMEDLNTGKTIFYTLEMQNKILRLIRNRENTSA